MLPRTKCARECSAARRDVRPERWPGRSGRWHIRPRKRAPRYGLGQPLPMTDLAPGGQEPGGAGPCSGPRGARDRSRRPTAGRPLAQRLHRVSPEPTSGDVFLLGASTFVMFAFVLAAALWVAGRLSRPLRDLTAAAQQVGASGEPQEVIIRGPGDVRRRLEAFNAMSRRVSQLLGEKDVMLGALGMTCARRWPSLRIRIETHGAGGRALKAVKTIEEASELLEDILELARQGRSRSRCRPWMSPILVEDMVEDYAETGAPCVRLRTEKAPVACRPVLFRRALRNLIDNAVAYGERARLSVTQGRHGAVLVRIEDDGPGMSAEALASAADPFYRGDASRNRGHGRRRPGSHACRRHRQGAWRRPGCWRTATPRGLGRDDRAAVWPSRRPQPPERQRPALGLGEQEQAADDPDHAEDHRIPKTGEDIACRRRRSRTPSSA